MAIVGTLLFGIALTIGGVLTVPEVPWLGLSMAIGGLITVVVIGISLRRPPRAEGHSVRLGECDAPILFAEIERLRQAVGGPRMDIIAIDDEFNACVIEARRFELVGSCTRTMRLGLPLMSALSPDELRFVIGHEIAHLSRAHGQSWIWLVRVGSAWSTILDHVHDSDRWTDRALTSFANWYLPLLGAARFGLSRAHEYEADRLAAAATSPAAGGSALCALEVRDEFMGRRFWPSVWRSAARSEIIARPFGHISGELRRALTQNDATRWLRQAMAREADADSTHPALRDRLSALGVAPTLAPAPPTSGAEAFLGAALPAITARLDAQWGDQVGQSWQAARQHYLALQAELDELRQSAAWRERQPDALDLRRMAGLVAELHGPDAARPHFEALHARFPDDAVGLLRVGGWLLADEDVRGLAMVERAMALDAVTAEEGAGAIAAFHWRHGRLAEAQLVLDRARPLLAAA